MPRIRSTNSGGREIRGYLKLDFAHFWLGGGAATEIRVLGIYRKLPSITRLKNIREEKVCTQKRKKISTVSIETDWIKQF